MASNRQPFKFLNGALASSEISVEERSFFLLETSLLLTNTSFAVHYRMSRDGSFEPIVDDTGAAVTVAVGPNQAISFTSDSVVKTMAAADAIKFVGSTPELAERDMFLTME